MMKEDTYVAGQVERALHGDPRTHELGIRVEVDGDTVVLRGEVASEERRVLATKVAEGQAPGFCIRNEMSVTEVLPPEDVPEVLPVPEETAPVREIPPPHEASS